MAELATQGRIEVVQDNYGDWRWYCIEGGETINRSDGYFDTREEAVEDAHEAYHHMPIVVDGASYDISKLPEPPKIDVLLEAARAGLPAPTQLSPEQQKVMEETRSKLIAMQHTADDQAKALVDAEKALTEQARLQQPAENPDEGMGLDGGPKEEDQPVRPRAKRRGAKDVAPTPEDEPADPLAAQRARRNEVANEG